MIKIIKARKANVNIKKEMNKLFIDSFYDYFRTFSDDKEKLSRCLKNVFDLNKFYVVILDEELIAMGACGNGVDSTIKFKKRHFMFSLGISKGKRAYKYFKLIMEDRDYAFDIDKACGMIEFVAVKENYRNKKIAFTLINHMICDNNYKRYLDRRIPFKENAFLFRRSMKRRKLWKKRN